MHDFLEIRGARVHNLKNISLSLPHNQFTVITGVSGSGKSSLAFDTIYAEGQRRYVESLSAYARQFLERMEKPDVDDIDGIAPAIAIRQKNTTRNPRSTVATTTEIYDFLRLLYARAGRTICPNDGLHVQRDSVDQVAQRMLAEPAARWYVLFPAHATKDGAPDKDHLFELRKHGFNRLYQDGRIVEFSTPESLLELDFTRPIDILADRLAIADDQHQRIVDSVEICYRESGEAIFEHAETNARLRFSEAFVCKQCLMTFQTPEPRLFSFNSPFGACPKCQGFGNTVDYDLDLIIPDKSLSIADDAIKPWRKSEYRNWLTHLRKAAADRVRLNVAWYELTAAERAFVVDGEGRKPGQYSGIRGFFAALEGKKYKMHVRLFLARYRGYTECPECRGARVRKEALYVQLSGHTVEQTVKMNIGESLAFFDSLELSPEETAIAAKVLVEIRQRLRFLNDVGLEYLTLDRLSSTLSGGEMQRIQLATCLGSRLVGACYVLDEPSIGLHSRDTGRLIRILHELRDLGNTILVVEHDPEVMRAADHIVDLGPGAGERGGHVIFEGPAATLTATGNGSLTAQYLSGALKVSLPRQRRKRRAKHVLKFTGATANNLKNVDVEIPLGLMCCVTGVSGSGKSTLVHDVIYQSLKALLRQAEDGVAINSASAPEDADDTLGNAKVTCRRVDGAQQIGEIVMVDQSPIGRTPRSNPITYIQAFDIVRGLFADTAEAKKRNYVAGHFSFNVAGGRCETCQGDGTVKVEMQFLADVELICEECKGTRFKSGVLEVKYRGRNIHEALKLTVDEAIEFFSESRRLSTKLQVLSDVGLGYLRLGQSATTLSGGEAQRVKLAAYLSQATNERTLYIFDEPTTGLHFDDIRKLLDAFERLLASGASLLVIEHNLDVIRASDWLIDLGPEGGAGGGSIVAAGTPDQVMAVEQSHTGRYLRANQ